MISCEKYRTSISITLGDIFADFNDSRKETLMKRVKLALEDLQIRMRNEVEGNNLANLQMLLKKQQALKKMEEKVQEITEEIEEKRQRDHYLNGKVAQLQAELTKSAESQRNMHDKVKALIETINRKQAQLFLREEANNAMGKQVQDIQKQNQRLEMERQKLEDTVKRLRESYHHKTEETELILKIKEKKMEQSINESITNIQIRQQREKEKREIENKLKSPKVDKKNQKIQVAFAPSPSPIPTTSRVRESQFTNRQPARHTVDREVQTLPTQEKKISQFIDNTPPKQAEKLEEIRLVYSATPKFLPTVEPPPQEPKITKFYAPETSSISMQTEPVIFKPPSPVRLEKTCQVCTEEDRSFIQLMGREIEDLKGKYSKMEQFHDRRYWELLKIYEARPSQEQDLKEIELLRLTLLETQLQLAKKDREVADQRQLYSRARHELHESQNNVLLKRLSVKLEHTAMGKKPGLNQTCSFFHSNSPKRIPTHLSQNEEPENEEDQLFGTYNAKFKKITEEDVITVTKSKNALKYRRHSLKTSMVEGQESRQRINKEYQKYSKLKATNTQ